MFYIDENVAIETNRMILNNKWLTQLNNNLSSSLALPQQTIFGIDAYPTVEDKAAILVYSLVKNHSFVDGNKRTAIILFMLFLKKNGVKLNYKTQDYFNFIIKVAGSTDKDKHWIVEWIRNGEIK